MIETISGPRRLVSASCAAFGVGACLGGIVTFALLGLVGRAAHSFGHALPFVAVVAGAAGIAEARGMAVAPQIRRQVPEHWRRVVALPLAAGLYGILLGIGFTTFVYTFALWALVAIVLLLGSPVTGVLTGLAFGAGRALPVVLLAPIVHVRFGRDLVDRMAQRPRTLSVVRLAVASCLLVVVLAVLGTAAGAATNLGSGTDPSVSGTSVVWTAPIGGVLRQEDGSGAATVPPRATVGGSLLAWRDGSTVHVARLADLSPVLDLDVTGVNAIAVSDEWLVTRAQVPGGEKLTARSLSAPSTVVPVATAHTPTRLGRPALDGSLLVYHVAASRLSSIVAVDLAGGTRRVVRRSASGQLTNPAVLGADLVYDRLTNTAQLVQVGPIDRRGSDRIALKLNAPSIHDAGHESHYSNHTRTRRPRPANWRLWTTALSSRNVYVTLLPRIGSPASARLVSVAR